MKLEAREYIEWRRIIWGAIEGSIILGAALLLAWYLL